MLNVVLFLVDLIERHILWVYAACLLVILINVRAYIQAHRDRVNTIFPVEREVAAHKEGRAFSNIGIMLGIAVIATALRYYVVPSLDLTAITQPTPTVALLIATSTPTPTPLIPTPTATPRPTPTRIPTVAMPTRLPTPPTPTPVPVSCPDPNICITFPRNNQTLSGQITIQGTATHERFQFYKIEWGAGESPEAWHSINEIVRTPVVNGPLMPVNTAALPNGVVWFKLTVVDITGNFPPPYAVRVIIQN